MNDALATQQTQLYAVSRALINFKKTGKEKLTPASIRQRMASLQNAWAQCLKGHAALLQLCPESKRETIAYFKERQLDEHDLIHQEALDYMAECLEEVEPFVSPNRSLNSTFSQPENQSFSLKHLPPIELPPFSGKTLEWETFRDRFKSLIIQNKELTDFARMHFLASSLVGSARNAISNFAITAENFPTAWKALMSRYENKRKLVETYLSALHELPLVQRESAAELYSLRDHAERTINAFKRLNRTADEMLSDVFIFFISNKLDQATRRAWKLKCSSEGSLPSFDQFIRFISSRAMALEELAPANPSKSSRTVKSNNATASKNSAIACDLCKAAHYLSQCPQFLSKNLSQRREYVKQSKRCFNCLGSKHSVADCRSKYSCRSCQQKHHSLLHIDSVSSSNVNTMTASPPALDTADPETNESPVVAHSSVSMTASPISVLLATAKVTVTAPTGRAVAIRALLDQGSEVTFITERLAKSLRLNRTRTLTSISAVGCANIGTCKHAVSIVLSPRDKSEPRFSTTALILQSLTKYSPRESRDLSEWPHLSSLHLADNDPTGSTPIDLIIGADLYSQIILNGVRKGRAGQPIAQKSHLGWLISGPIPSDNFAPRSIQVHHCSLDQEIRKFWEVEDIPRPQILSPDEIRCENYFINTYSRFVDGRFTVRLPFKQGTPINIGASRSIAIRKLESLKRRLDANVDLKSEYAAFLSEYASMNHMEQVEPPVPSDNQIVYIPHHPVIRDSSATTRLRVVFNASSSTSNGTSLNCHLDTGAKLQTDLSAVLLRWRQYKYVYTAYIAKMYRQILVDPRDQDYQRIVWFDKEFLSVQVYLTCDEGDQYPLAVQILKENIYVDDVLFGAEDIPLLKCAREQICSLLSSAQFSLRKWASNHSALLAEIPSENHNLAHSRNLQADETVPVLGITWTPSLDTFQFKITLPNSIPRTKRQILSMIAKIFDPLGWVTPVTISAKIFMQHLWRLHLDWDDIVPSPAINRWEVIFRTFSTLNSINIPRWTKRDADINRIELHGFADASNVAYAAVIHMRVISLSGEVSISMLTGKAKVAPIKTLSTPRLELLATVLLARLLQFVLSVLNLPESECYCWTASTVVLHWIRSHPSKWTSFVANRVADIQTRIPHALWRHISTVDNPADCASRGLILDEIHSASLWWQGLPWLKLPSSEWPEQTILPPINNTDEERKITSLLTSKKDPWDLASRYSSWPKLLRVTAYLLKFIENCRISTNQNDKNSNSMALTTDHCLKARQFWIRYIQNETFASELKALRQGKELSSTQSISALRPFLDADDIIRVGGRLENSKFPFDHKHPMLLAPHCLTKLIVRHIHIQTLHSGVQLTLATLRRQYWLIKARSIVKTIIHQCIPCVRERAAVPSQLMGQLPLARVSIQNRPFLHSGVDYAGPVFTRLAPGRGVASRKGYIVIFICLASRAVHLELVSDYSSNTFLNAFSRFCSRRGLPTNLYSDNGTTFVGADKELRLAYLQAARNPDFLNQIASDQISWQFIPPHAPHFGGLWESGVKSIKHHLSRVLGSHTLTYEEFSTLLYRIEACLNSRPIGPLTDTLEDYEPLTPGHLLIGTAITTPPEPSLHSINESRLSRWQLLRQINEKFWKLWQSDYVNALQQRTKWRKVQPSIQIGTMVLLRNPLLPPCKWELGRVTQIFPGPNGLVRVVSVRTAQSEFKRPIVKLCVLPIDSLSPCELNNDQN